jgi:all-trans-8'-apo-beta-carotenal 15,15'-oxygenase
MSVTALPSSPKAWSNAISQPAREFSATSLPILSGKIPDQLRGSLYRNGPGLLQRGNKQIGHWFDGDGAILAVHFTDAGATGVYRFVQTKGYQQEEAVNSFIYPNYGMTASGSFWNNWLKEVKNTANTSVLSLSNRLLALWEGGFPYALDLQTLETWGTDNLSGLSKDRPFSAHPKIDPLTKEIYNFGVGAGLNATLNLYRSDPRGQIKQQNTFPLNGLPLVHDFILAGRYLVFFVPPVRVNFLPVILGKKSYSDSMEWKPELGTQILIFNRDTLSLVSRNEAEPWYQWHIANGYEDEDGFIVTEILRYRDFQTNQYLKEVATGKTQTLAKGTLWQIRLDPQTAKVIEMTELLERSCEFPVIPQHQVGQSWRNTYLSIHRDGTDISQEIFGAIARFDHQTGNFFLADMGENRYPSEPIYAPYPDNPDNGWLLTVVYDGNTDSSEVRIYDSHNLETEPICRLGLPNVIPPSFHGTWQPG